MGLKYSTWSLEVLHFSQSTSNLQLIIILFFEVFYLININVRNIMSQRFKNLHAAPAKCLEVNTEQDKFYIGNETEEHKMVDSDRTNFKVMQNADAEECRGFCLTARAKHFSYADSEHCFCTNETTESKERANSVSGNTSLTTCNGE